MTNIDFTPIFHALETGDKEQLTSLVSELNPSTIADLISQLSDEQQLRVFLVLDMEDKVDVIAYLEFDIQLSILQALTVEMSKSLIEKMPHDTRVDLLNRLPYDKRNGIMRHLAKVERDDILKLSEFKEGTTGSIMTSDYAILHPNQTAQQAIEKLRVEAPDHEMIYYAYVVDKDRKLIGTVSMRALIVSEPDAKVSELLTSDVEKVNVKDPEEQASRKLKRLDLLALPVVDDEDKLVGMITFDDAMQAIEEDVSDTMYQKAGVMSRYKHPGKSTRCSFQQKADTGEYPISG